jgi:hypothetical protein
MKRTAVLLVIAAVLLVLVLPGCGTPAGPSTTFPPSPTATLPPGQEPVRVISVTGPWEPVNPGGPNVDIVLENGSAENVIFLEATLDLDITASTNPYLFHFDVSSSRPLAPGASVNATQTLIGGGFSDTTEYSLTIQGILAGNVAFSYTKLVFITSPP